MSGSKLMNSQVKFSSYIRSRNTFRPVGRQACGVVFPFIFNLPAHGRPLTLSVWMLDRPLPLQVQVLGEGEGMSFVRLPEREEIPVDVNEPFIVEYYAQRS